MNRRLLYIGCMFISLAGACGDALAQRTARRCQVMATVAPEGYGMTETMLSAIYSEAFRRIGLCLFVIRLPAARASMENDKGMVDGELGRGPSYGLAHPTLARVGEPAAFMRLSAYVRDPGPDIAGWGGLRAKPYNVEYRLGIEAARKGLQAVSLSSPPSSVPHTIQGLKKLAVGRTDVYIDFDEHVGPLLQPHCLVLRRHITRAGVLQVLPVHAYLSRNNTALAAKLSAALKDMRDEGLLTSYQRVANSKAEACQ